MKFAVEIVGKPELRPKQVEKKERKNSKTFRNNLDGTRIEQHQSTLNAPSSKQYSDPLEASFCFKQ